jgi:RHS repeat-associated protein
MTWPARSSRSRTPTGSYGFAYDNMGRLVGTTTQYAFLPGTPAPTFSNSYAYDATSNRTSFTAPDGSTNTYAYDTLGRLSTLTNSLTGQFGFSYDALNRRTALNRPNGVNTAYGYDSLSRLLNVLHKAGTVTLDGAGYTYDNAGNRTAKTNYLNNITEQYTYDPLYQLTQVTQGTTTIESYSYDAVGNRLSSVGMSPYVYNSSNQLTSMPGATFTHDGNGNTLTKADSSGTTTYNWDFENRLTSVLLPGSGGMVTFKYDPLGRRIQKSSATATTNYLYDGGDAVEELDASRNEVARYAQGEDLDEPLAQLRSGTTSYYEQDGLGSITSLGSPTGTTSNSYTYDAFGNLIASTGSLGNPFQYTARDYDSETGLRYYRSRYYDPTVGRFLSEDPIGFDGGMNFYSYVTNSPVGYVDPGGLAMTPAQCAELLKDIMRRVEKVAEKSEKYNPIEDGIGNHPYSAGGKLKNSIPGEHYWTIIRYQTGIWRDVLRYQNECKDSQKCPQRVFEIGWKKIPEPVYPTSPFSDWLNEQKWEWQSAWRQFMNPKNPPWWYWFNPNAGRPKPSW